METISGNGREDSPRLRQVYGDCRLSAPAKGARSLAALENHESIEKILPIEGQGSIFLQLADICVGAVNFRLAGRKSRNKQKLAKKAIEILKKLEQKNEVEADCVYATSTIGSISEFIKNVNPSITLGVDGERSRTIRGQKERPYRSIYAAYGEDNLWLNRLEISILRDSDLSRGNVFKTSWRKVSLLKPGMLIATADGPASTDSFGVVKWERITKIEKLRAEQVLTSKWKAPTTLLQVTILIAGLIKL